MNTRLALLAASALVVPALARAQTITLPTVPAGGVVVQNATGASVAARGVTTGVGFAKGSVAGTTTGLTASINGTTVAAQLDVHSTWPDGSARWASASFAAPALTAGASVSVSLSAGGTAGAALAWPNPALTVSLLGSSLNVGQALSSSTDTWLSGPEAVQRRADMAAPGDSTGAMHLVVDATCFADGACEYDVQPRRDLSTVTTFSGSGSQSAALAPVSYTLSVASSSGTTSTTVANQNQYQDLHLIVGSLGRNVQHDIAGLEAAGLVPPYDLTTGIATGSGSGYASDAATMAQSSFGTPLATNGVATYMPTTGGRYDIGITTGANAIWLRTQDDAARRFALAQADTGATIPWHFWNASTGRWLDAVDYPNLWATQVSYTDYLTNALPPNDTTNNPSTQPWVPVMNHAPNLDYIPALLTGSRFYRDMQAAQASASVLWDWPTNRRPVGAGSGGGDQIFGGLEVRELAWDYREIVEAWALASTGGAPAAHFAQVLLDSWTFWNNNANAPAWIKQDGTVGLMVPNRYGTADMYPMWEHAYMLSAFGMGVLLGDPGANTANAFPAVVATTEQSAVPQTGYDPANSIEYVWNYESNAGSFVTSWAALQAMQKANGWPRTPAQLDTYGDYDSLLRQSLAMALRVNSSDSTATAGLAGLYGAVTSATSNISAPTYQGASTGGNLVQEALAIPAVTASNAWATQEASLSNATPPMSAPAPLVNPLAGISPTGMLPNGTCLSVFPAPGNPLTPCGAAQAFQDLVVAPVTADPHQVGRFYLPSGGKATASGG